jgi:Ca2+-binding RTX toxin-like protein
MAEAPGYCYNLQVTISITSAGSYSGTSGNDVVRIMTPSGSAMTYYEPVGGRDHICADTAGGPIMVWTAGSGHWISTSPYNDTIYGSEGPDNVGDNGGNDTYKGNGGNDRLYGYSGNDYIRGGDGDDVVHGGSGDDCLLGGSGYNEIIGENGADTILINKTDRYSSTQCAPAEGDTSSAATTYLNSPGSGGGTVYPGNDNDRVFGSNSNDYITDSGSGNDILRGNSGNDSIQGGIGSDYLNGGSGNDILSDSYTDNAIDLAYGGAETDTFYVFSGGAEHLLRGFGSRRDPLVQWWSGVAERHLFAGGRGLVPPPTLSTTVGRADIALQFSIVDRHL